MTNTSSFKEIAKQAGISPRLDSDKAAARLAIWSEKATYALRNAYYGIRWAHQTGRLNAAADMTISRMTAYQTLKLVVELANAGLAQNDIPRELNRRYS